MHPCESTTNFDHCDDVYHQQEYRPHSTDLFFYPNINIKENVVFRVQVVNGIGLHIDASTVVWTLIDISKLANQIARLVAIVFKKIISHLRELPSTCKEAIVNRTFILVLGS